jgi:hypothetical protein
MANTQAKLKACIENESLKSLDRLSDLLDSGDQPEDMEVVTAPAIDASETFESAVDVSQLKGENKVFVGSKSKKRKHKFSQRERSHKVSFLSASEGAKSVTEKPKQKPRFFCKF